MIYGTATAAYQIEGAAFEDGKGLSVWDVFCERPKAIKNGDTGNISCDHYHKYKEDIRLLSELGVNSYRFSINWPRILPNGIGEVNPKGIIFYNNLINELLKYNIQPCITLFHWDYPYELDKQGGWLNDKSSDWFEYYTEVVAKNFGDRVKMFITFNEPQVFIGHGHATGQHAPGKRLSMRELTACSFNVLLSHGKAVKKLRELIPDCKVGYTSATTPAIPVNSTKKNIDAAYKEFFSFNKYYWFWNTAWWCDPVFKGTFPESAEFSEISKFLPQNYNDCLEIIYQPLDFCGINCYNGNYYDIDKNGNAVFVPHSSNASKTAIGWPVTPDALYWVTKFMYERYKLPIIITENGMACHDTVSLDGGVHDFDRIDYLSRYLSGLEKAKSKGIDIIGYYTWSFMDNFEWSEGYQYRFGLTYINYETGERIKKDSFRWYNKYIKENV